MTPDGFEGLARLVALGAAAVSVVYACIRAGVFFGHSESTLKTLSQDVKGLTEVLSESTRRWEAELKDHGVRLTRVETRLNMSPGRRRTDEESA